MAKNVESFILNLQKCKIFGEKITGKIWRIFVEPERGMHIETGKTARGAAKIRGVIIRGESRSKKKTDLTAMKKCAIF